MPKRLTLKDYFSESQLFNRRIITSTLLVSLLALSLIIRFVYLQVIEHKRYIILSHHNQVTLLPIAPNRGLIYDRHGVLLAENLPVFSLEIIPDHVKDPKETITQLKKIINISNDDIEQFYKSIKQHRPFEPIPLKLKLTEEEVASFYVNQYHFPGVVVNARLIRHYLMGSALSNVTGYVGRINAEDLRHIDTANYGDTNFIGKVGIEKYYENELHGKVGYQQAEVDAGGHIFRVLKRIPPIPGDDLYLTIDSRLQIAAIKALGKERGAIVAIQPKTGQVLALVSHPSYDPNLFVTGINAKDYQKLQNSPAKPLYNRAIRGRFPSASTIKPFFALEGLDSHIITPNTTIKDPGWFKLPNNNHIYHDWKPGGHGLVNVSKGLIVSCDTFFYQLAVNLGITRMVDILNRFGFGRVTSIDLAEEMPGLVPNPTWKRGALGTSWYTGDTIILGIGQGFMLTTPLELANATATLANRGQHFKPELMLSLKHPDATETQTEPLLKDSVMLNNNQAWGVVIDAMQKVITSTLPWGTGYSFGRNPAYTIAAKTGTGQVYSFARNHVAQDQLPKHLRDHSLFIAFAPVENPEIALAVIVENSPIAPIVARKVMDYYLITEKNQIEAP